MFSNEIHDQFDEAVIGAKNPFKHICYPYFHRSYRCFSKSSGNIAKRTGQLLIISLVQKLRVAQWENGVILGNHLHLQDLSSFSAFLL